MHETFSFNRTFTNIKHFANVACFILTDLIRGFLFLSLFDK